MFDSHQLPETNVFMPLDLSLRSSRFLETLFRRFPSFIAGAMQELKAIGLISETFKTVESSYSAQDGKITVRKDRQRRTSSCVSRGPVYIECSLTFHRADGRELPLAVDVVTETPVVSVTVERRIL